VTGNLLFGIACIFIGGVLAVQAPRAALAQLRTGEAKGRVNSFHRDRNPVGFWLSVVATAVAAILGLASLLLGLAQLGTSMGLVK